MDLIQKGARLTTSVYLLGIRLRADDLATLKHACEQQQINLQFRSKEHQVNRELIERPLAFICNDSRDKETVARPVAIELQKGNVRYRSMNSLCQWETIFVKVSRRA